MQEGVKAGANTPPIFSYPRTVMFATVLRMANKIIGLTVGERGVCILRTGSNQSSPFLI